MSNCLRWRRFFAFAPLILPAISAAATPTITPEQIEMLRQLPAAQRELLRKTFLGETGRIALPETTEPDEGERDGEEGDRPQEQPALGHEDDPTTPVRFQPGDTLLIYFREIETRETEEAPRRASRGKRNEQVNLLAEERVVRQERRAADERLRAARMPTSPMFVLDQFGAVTIDNVGRFVLAGLNEAEASERIAAEPAFSGLRVRVKRLPIEPELKRFGHDLFTGTPRTFAPATDIPVPADYVVGPGDVLIVQLLGRENVEHELTVTRDGTVLFPGIGPIAVSGMKFSRLQTELRRRVERQFTGAQASVTLGRLRSIRVFILGHVQRPGSYTVSSLSTLTNALLASGGVTPVGTLRDIQLKRDGAIVSRLDLYDLLLRGDTRGDARLLPGDVVFVPPVGRVVGVSGRVRRPALYELKSEESIRELLEMAAGLMPDANAQGARVERAVGGRSAVLNVDLNGEEGQGAALRDGDILRVFPLPEQLQRSVRLVGRVLQAGQHEWRPQLRLTDVIPSLDVLQADADARYVLITRERAEDRRIEVIGADPVKALADRGGAADILLQPRDELRIFSVHDDRAALIQPILERAKLASSPAQPWREVRVGGSVHHPGSYPWSPDMTVEDLLHAGGGLTERAYTLEAELTRYAVPGGEQREQVRELIRLEPGAESTGMATKLAPHDRLVVRHVPHWEDDATVEILGEVRFPGRYPIVRGERLSQVIERAGGLTRAAYSRAAIFLRETLRQREEDYLEQLIAQLERDLVVVRTEGPEIGVRKESAVSEGEALLRQMRTARATGRMVVDIDAVLNLQDEYDVTMQAGDKLVIPQRPDEVTVVGEVYYPTSHVYVSDRLRNEYVRLSGGITERGNKRAAYVVHADGSVSPPPRWFGADTVIGPGDTIIVPVKVDRIGNLKLFTDISTILFQLSVTAAALNSIGVF